MHNTTGEERKKEKNPENMAMRPHVFKKTDTESNANKIL
jgi:hypothetical protein